MDIATSPDRYSFELDSYIKSCQENGREPDPLMIDFFQSQQSKDCERTQDSNWCENNLEWDLRTTSWILKKVQDRRYAQNLYAAMCNMRWQRLDVMPILKDEFWSCSWRYAGGIIAHMRGEGDYVDWYCSGIADSDDHVLNGTVAEGVVTKEVEEDLRRLGWQPADWPDEE